MFTIKVIGGDVVGSAVRQFQSRMSPERMKKVIAHAGEKVWKEHYRAYYTSRPNALGAPSTGYWREVHDSVHAEITETGVTLTSRGKGLRHKYYGGIVKPSGRISDVTAKPITMLSIPVHPRAHGKTIGELGGLRKFYIVPFMGGPGSGYGAGVFFRSGRTTGRRRSDPLYFVLKKTRKITADKNIIPKAFNIVTEMHRRIQALTKTP